MYSNMYHNLFVQLIGAMGILGLLAFIVHVKSFIEILVRKFTVGRLMIGLGVVAVLLASLLDNFFFIFSFQLFYGALLAPARSSSRKNGPPCSRRIAASLRGGSRASCSPSSRRAWGTSSRFRPCAR